ncbi:MAG: hypothetical protein NVS4B5_20360 [Vulcanimicrobiaceae bacterium]
MSMKETLAGVIDSAHDTARKIGLEHDGEEGGHDAAPDALAIIKADHDRVADLFKRALADDSNVTKMRPLVAEILSELETHAKMEESLFYPALYKKSKSADEDRQRVLEAAEEHGTLKDLMKKIKKSTGRDETLRAKVQVLSELVKHHVEEEEHEMFDEARRLLGEKRLEALGVEMTAFKSRGKRGRTAGKTTRATAKGTTAKRRTIR